MYKEFYCDDCEEFRTDEQIDSICTWQRIGPDEYEYENYCAVCEGCNISRRDHE